MKKLKSLLLPVLAVSICFASCSKKDDTKTTTPTPTTPTNTAGPQPPTPMPSGNNLSGALISVQMKYTTQPTGAPMPVDVTSEMGVAVFYATAGSTTKADAGTVSVNSIDLTKQTDKSYMKWAYIGGTPSDLDFDNTSNWNVTGSGDVQAFSYDDNSTFPNYTGTVPESITKANGISLTFSTGTLSGADSVYVVIAAGDKSVTKSYYAKAGTVTISASDLQNLPVVSDNSAVLEICPFRYKEVVKNGKNYFFIKEQAIVRALNIN